MASLISLESGRPSGVPRANTTVLWARGGPVLQRNTHAITKTFLKVFGGMNPEEEPLRPEAVAFVTPRRQNPQESAFTQCLPGGIPATLLVQTFKIIQTPQEIVMLPEV